MPTNQQNNLTPVDLVSKKSTSGNGVPQSNSNSIDIFSSNQAQNRFEANFINQPSQSTQNGLDIKDALRESKREETKKILKIVYNALEQKGYNPSAQIIGYFLTEDPTYITNYNNARTLMYRIDRYEALEILLKDFLKEN